MIAQAQAKLLAVTAQKGKDKLDGREFTWYKIDLLSPESGVSTFTAGNDYTPLVDSQVLVTFDVKSKTEAKLVKLEKFEEGEKEID